jgi:hypothetical protein
LGERVDVLKGVEAPINGVLDHGRTSGVDYSTQLFDLRV